MATVCSSKKKRAESQYKYRTQKIVPERFSQSLVHPAPYPAFLLVLIFNRDWVMPVRAVYGCLPQLYSNFQDSNKKYGC